jgi:hypothetical protein
MLTSLADGEGAVVVPDGRAVVGGPVAGVGPARRPVLQQRKQEQHSDQAGSRGDVDSRNRGSVPGGAASMGWGRYLVWIHGRGRRRRRAPWLARPEDRRWWAMRTREEELGKKKEGEPWRKRRVGSAPFLMELSWASFSVSC